MKRIALSSSPVGVFVAALLARCPPSGPEPPVAGLRLVARQLRRRAHDRPGGAFVGAADDVSSVLWTRPALAARAERGPLRDGQLSRTPRIHSSHSRSRATVCRRSPSRWSRSVRRLRADERDERRSRRVLGQRDATSSRCRATSRAARARRQRKLVQQSVEDFSATGFGFDSAGSTISPDGAGGCVGAESRRSQPRAPRDRREVPTHVRGGFASACWEAGPADREMDQSARRHELPRRTEYWVQPMLALRSA